MKSMNMLVGLIVSAVAACAPATIVRTEVVYGGGPDATQPEAAPSTVMHFDGAGAGIAWDNPELPQGDAPRTLSAWFRTSDAQGAHVIANWGTAQVGQRFGILMDNGRIKLVGEFQDIMTATTYADGAWHHAAAVFSTGGASELYVDGKVVVSGFLQLDTEGQRLVIGNAPADHAPELWNGDIDRVQVFPRAMASAEIGQLVNGASAQGDVANMQVQPAAHPEWQRPVPHPMPIPQPPRPSPGERDFGME